MARKKQKQKKKKKKAKKPNKHVLYEASVQSADAYIELIESIFENTRKRKLSTLREDFCGTARLCCEWVLENPDIETWGVDLDPEVLEWGRENHISYVDDNADRVHLICDDVRTAKAPKTEDCKHLKK